MSKGLNRKGCGWRRRVYSFCVAVGLPVLFAGAVYATGQWVPLAEDDLHDPDNPAIKLLQEPREALSELPFDYPGNQVNWVRALEEGFINPRTNIYPGSEIRVLDLDILMTRVGDQGYVIFPHKQHTEWLDCSNCHEEIFASKAGTTPVTMMAILEGRYCGRCHGAVSFPLSECARCHSKHPHSTGYGLATQAWPPTGAPKMAE